MYVLHLFLLSVTFAFTAGFSTSPVKHTVSSSNALETGGISPEQTRVTFLTNVLLGTTALFSPLTVYAKTDDVTLPNGVVYTVVKQGSGPKPERGELVAIRFAAYNGDIQIDNIFDSPEPYYTRLGSGGLIQGVEETLPLMQLGDRWRLTIPVRPFFTIYLFSTLSS